MRAHRSRRPGRPALATVLTLMGLLLSGCGEEDANALAPESPVEVPDIRGPEDLDDPYSGVLDAAFREDLEAYTDAEVTLLAEVAEVLSPRAFTVTSPDGEEVDPVLVVTTADSGDVDPRAGQSLIIAATAVEDFDAGVVAEELDVDLDVAQAEEWDDETFLLATVLEPAP